MFLYRNGRELGRGVSFADDQEIFNTIFLSADTYTIAFQDWRFEDPDRVSDYPQRVCFDITANPN